MTELVEIFVALIDEGVDVWCPVRARHVEGAVYRIEDQPYDREFEQSQFEPGHAVVCEIADLGDGARLVAVREEEDQA